MTTSRQTRETLWSNGRKGDADWMRVLLDAKADRVEVKFKDGRGLTKKEIFASDKKSQAKAIVWAKEYLEERKRLGAARADVTHAQLWKAYSESPAWRDLRDKSKTSYAERWGRWVRFRGDRTRPDETTLHHVDRFITGQTDQHYAINQTRNALNVARVVYNWGQSRKLVSENVFANYRWKSSKDAVVNEPDEYAPEEFGKLLAAASPQSSKQWRVWVCLMIGGHHGGRAHAVLNLKMTDIVGDEIVWPRAFQKNGKELRQPLTWDMVAALETVRYWRAKLLYRGEWMICGGTHKTRGQVRELDAWMKDPKHKRVGTGKGKPREVVDKPYSYSGLHSMLIETEKAAGVPHRPWRAFHGTRKMVAGNIVDRTGEAGLAMEWLNDDIRQANKYVKRRSGRLDRAADATKTGVNE